MSLQPQPHEPDQSPAVRVSDDDRSAMVERLRIACGAGLLTLDEFSDRVGDALAAQRRTDLERLVVDLPQPEAPARPRRKATRWLVGILGGAEQRGRWRPDESTTAIAVMGGCTVDLRRAEIDGPEVVVNAVAVMGGVDVIVPEGIEVQLTGIALLGGKDCRTADVPPLPGSPVVRVRVFAVMGGVTVRTKKAGGEGSHERGRERTRHEDRAERHQHRAERQRQRADRFAAEAEGAVVEGRLPPVDGTVTVLFTDIEDFTGLSERLGDLEAAERLQAHYALVRREVAAHGGVEVKCQGDGFMVAFDGARRGLRAAVAIQRALRASEAVAADPLLVRMGLHTGEAIREDNDLFGRTVIVAARITASAAGGEILVSSLLKDLSEGSGEFRFGAGREATLKGLSGAHQLYPLEWQGA